MSRSSRKTPKRGLTAAVSEKAQKSANHQRERRLIRQVLTSEPEQEILPRTKELSDPWAMSKDGKVYLGKRATRKDLGK